MVNITVQDTIPAFPLSDGDAARLVRDSLASDAAPWTAHTIEGGVLYTRGAERIEGPAVVAIGAFDGVHLGHRSLIAAAVADARSRGASCVCVTFDPDPAQVVAPGTRNTTLLPVPDRIRRFSKLGVDAVLALTFDDSLRSTGYERFVEGVLRPILDVVSIHVGSDFRMGRGRGGDVDAIRAFCEGLGIDVFGEHLLDEGGVPVSATRIRKALADGHLDDANLMLGRCHFVRGRVSHGRGEGTGFGFPTANVVCPLDLCMPKDGVYACYLVVDGIAWPAAANVGAPRSFTDEDMPAFLEANLIGFEGDIYGREVEVVFVRFLRESKRFDDFDELVAAVMDNIEWTRTNLGSTGVRTAQ